MGEKDRIVLFHANYQHMGTKTKFKFTNRTLNYGEIPIIHLARITSLLTFVKLLSVTKVGMSTKGAVVQPTHKSNPNF